jgi:hypothetical protein
MQIDESDEEEPNARAVMHEKREPGSKAIPRVRQLCGKVFRWKKERKQQIPYEIQRRN